jgi:hypothetical protein
MLGLWWVWCGYVALRVAGNARRKAPMVERGCYAHLSGGNILWLQLLGFKFAIALVEIADINALHEQYAVINLVGESLFE